jgi:hypothetical protein
MPLKQANSSLLHTAALTLKSPEESAFAWRAGVVHTRSQASPFSQDLIMVRGTMAEMWYKALRFREPSAKRNSMRRSTVLATILVNSELYPTAPDAENAVRLAFANALPGQQFENWNVDIEVERAKSFIKAEGRWSSFGGLAEIVEMRGL